MKIRKLTLTPIIVGTKKIEIKNPDNPWYLMKCQIESLDRFTKSIPLKNKMQKKHKIKIPFINYKYHI